MFKRVLSYLTPVVVFILFVIVLNIWMHSRRNAPELKSMVLFSSLWMIVIAAVIELVLRGIFKTKLAWIWLVEIILLLIVVYIGIVK